MGIFAKPLGFLLQWLYKLLSGFIPHGAYGLAIVILTVVIKLCLYPLYKKQMKSTMGMSKLQPKMQELQQKYGKDKALYNEKVMELQKQEGVSMYGGCLPMLINMFVIMGLFTLLRNPIAYISDSSMIYAVHENFLWMQDLAQPDKWILPIVAGVATFFSFSMNQMQTGANAAQSNMMNQAMKWFFPIFILWMARTYPAGLAVYWACSQIIQILYNLGFKKEKERMKQEEEDRKNKGKRKVKKA